MVTIPRELNCSICGIALHNALDTYGDVGSELCETCWYDMLDVELDCWYGVASHVHDLSKTGSFIGSTVLTPLPAPDEHGVYAVDGLYFVPDAETEGGCGMWYENHPVEKPSKFAPPLDLLKGDVL